MPSLDQVTPLILTFDEEPNIGRALQSLGWARRIVVVDSHSRDRTAEIVQALSTAELFRRPFDNLADQWNYGLAQIHTEWVLSLDADYLLPESLLEEIANLDDDAAYDVYYAAFDYAVYGRRLRGSLYPPRAVLFRRTRARYVNDGHTQLLKFDGSSRSLKTRIVHDDRKPLGRWLLSQVTYAESEADKLLSSEASSLAWPDRLRRTTVLGPPGVFFYCVFVKGLLLDGWPGWYYTLQRVLAETILALRLMEKRFLRRQSR